MNDQPEVSEKMKQILKSEYSIDFDELRKNRVAVSSRKYGPVAVNFGQNMVDAIGMLQFDPREELGCLGKCLKKYKETGNTEYLLDAGNYIMFEFMFPKHPQAYFKATESKDTAGITGLSIKEAESFKE